MARLSLNREVFRQAVYEIVAAIPPGKVLTYGSIAVLAGCPGYHRLVGRTLRGTSQSMGLPCHRVVNAEGRLVPGWAEQRRLLQAEGVTFTPSGRVNMRRHGWRLDEEDELQP